MSNRNIERFARQCVHLICLERFKCRLGPRDSCLQVSEGDNLSQIRRRAVTRSFGSMPVASQWAAAFPRKSCTARAVCKKVGTLKSKSVCTMIPPIQFSNRSASTYGLCTLLALGRALHHVAPKNDNRLSVNGSFARLEGFDPLQFKAALPYPRSLK